MTAPRTEFHEGWGGAKLAVHRLGAGRPVLLLHGLFSSAGVNWIKFGTAARIADAGFEAIMPDLRAHGQSDAPHDPAAYPEDVLVKDALALVAGLGLADYDLGGFSLGARTSVRSVLAGLAPRRLVLGGMGLEGLAGWARRSAFFIDAIDRFDEIMRGDRAYFAKSFMKTQKVDRVATRLLLGSVDDTPPEAIAHVTMPTLVVCGAEDRDNGSAPRLAEALPQARYAEVPGTHMTSVSQRQFGDAIAEFLAA
ncbi:alpha/beta fold hydrolase [Novosphingobium album (ex Liu et al. 2023)]|uniref:Alpha/beta fold hydrolase n=1 Tax=Novosphingobium album (ex Liu et al. 2023) TaxID=3031130 RepID=A0ABT5WSG0_9SPHN|nr:alpha/beta fold hydrolase [Novosphingobium album (ex Liu et al. 2023)]MDE8652972.1 alpha/beta fold hydrolase [Novosphingobium album (ex Liu et al. 2023)]